MYMIVVLALVAVLGGGAFFFMNTSKEVASTPQPTPVAQEAAADTTQPTPGTPSTGDTAAAVTTTYKDGTYTQKGTYTSPAGAESVEVSVTLAGDVVTAATFKGEATNPGSVKNQGKFADGYTSLVVGKKIDDIALTVVNGSSLTPVGFMEALAKVKTEAKM
jgi:hypothetical protein